jgi:AcrR family transcriptional regulator
MSEVQRAPAEIEQRLLPVVEALLYENGYAGLNIREIAKSVGMGPATIYKYFSSKEGLVLRVLQDQDEQVAAAIRPALQGSDHRAKWLNFYDNLLNYYDDHPVTAVTQNVSMPTATWFLPEQRWPVVAVSGLVRDLIRQGRVSGALDPDVTDNQIMATHYMHLVREVRLWRTRDMRWQLASRIDKFFPIVWKTISRPAGEAGLRRFAEAQTGPGA